LPIPKSPHASCSSLRTRSSLTSTTGILIEKINGPFLYELRGTPVEYKAGLDRAIANGWLVLHESGTFVKFTQAGADLFA
jgi:hypothetical protein